MTSFSEAMGQIDMKNISSLDSIEIEKDIEQQIQEIVHQELEERTLNNFNSTTHENTNHSLTVMVKIFTIHSYLQIVSNPHDRDLSHDKS